MAFFSARMAILLLALPCLANQAGAAAYGYSYSNIFGFTISNPTGAITVFNNIDVSHTTATLGSRNVIHGGANEIDALQASLGQVLKGENDFAPQGMGNASYARGDAQIISSQIPPFPPGSDSTHVANVAEILLAGTGSADASGRNGSSTAFAVDLVVGQDGATLALQFQAAPFMQLYLDASAATGSFASASIAFTFSIVDEAGQIVFNWAPDGELGSGILGGTEQADDANLNINYAQTPPSSGSLFSYDPTGCGTPTGTGTGTGCGGQFSAISDRLDAGNYTLVLNMINSAQLAVMPVAAELPLPGTLLLLAAGLAALAGLGRLLGPDDGDRA